MPGNGRDRRFTGVIASRYSAFAYVIEGEGAFGSESRRVPAGQVVVFSKDGDAVTLANPADARPPDLLLIAGQALNEPVARWGPFVMNTGQEFRQATDDYRRGRLGLGQIGHR